MKIVLVHEEYPAETNFGGIATYQKRIAEKYVELGNKVYVICRGLKKDQKYIENGVNVIRIFVPSTNNKKRDYINYRKRVKKELLKLQNRNEIDIIETPDWGGESIFFEKCRKVPLVVRLHTPLKIWAKYNKSALGSVTKNVLEWENTLIHSADLITCCSSILKHQIINNYSYIDNNIYVTPNPANLKDFYLDKTIKKKEQIVFVGSVEQRKGVLVLAQALNIVFEKYPDLSVLFIGKDTVRNDKNISTVDYIMQIIKTEYHNNIKIIGQIENSEINKYLNESAVAVFPSLFDNFPYVVMEAMATGIQIVGSRNSGMVEMLEDKASIYNSGDYKDLAEKIIERYDEYKNNPINYTVIEKVNNEYNADLVCKNMLDLYSMTITKYNDNKINKKILDKVLQKIDAKDKVKHYKKEKDGLANCVYRIYTNKGNTYIIKKYLYKYNFNMINELYDAFEKNQISVIRPINQQIIMLNNYGFNVFKYYKNSNYNQQILPFLINLLSSDRKTEYAANILDKTSKYHEYLQSNLNKKFYNECKYAMDIYNKIVNNSIFNDRYLNHGDISKNNILSSNSSQLIIDFDETVVTSPLYDYAVVLIKFFSNSSSIDMDKYNLLLDSIKNNYPMYDENDFKQTIEFYLCKILLEKFYLHYIGKIDLFSNSQKKDDYRIYFNLLRSIEEQ